MANVKRRARYEVEQEYIVNGLLVTINKREKIYFERIEDFQMFYKIWVENEDLMIEKCLLMMKEELMKKTALNP
jgi:hypothetical protein